MSKRTCIFCGGSPVKAEHMPPQWIERYFEGATGGVRRMVTREGIQPRGDANTVAANVVKCVCEPCNNNWMSDIEDSVQPFLGPMLAGHGTVLDVPRQWALATWLVKNSLVLAYQGNKGNRNWFAPAYNYFFQKRQPSGEYAIYIGTAADRNQHELAFIGHLFPPEPDNTPVFRYCFCASFSIGHFFAVVLFRHQALRNKIQRPPPQRMREIFPGNGATFLWPVGPFFSQQEIHEMGKGPFPKEPPPQQEPSDPTPRE